MRGVAEARPPLTAGGEAEQWERHARWWQEHFTNGADPEYEEQIVPLGVDRMGVLGGSPRPSRVLDLGSGEGQLARALSGLAGIEVTAMDRSRTQLGAAAARGEDPRLLVGDAVAIPAASGAFGGVLACLVLEHVADLAGCLGEVARVLRPGGVFVAVLNHPLVVTPGSGWVDDHMVDPPEQYWQLGPYLNETSTLETVSEGVRITFHHRPLSRYVNTAASLGLLVDHIDEPAPPPGFVAQSPGFSALETLPRMMILRFRRS